MEEQMGFFENLGDLIEQGLEELEFGINSILEKVGDEIITPVVKELEKTESGQEILDSISEKLEGVLDVLESFDIGEKMDQIGEVLFGKKDDTPTDVSTEPESEEVETNPYLLYLQKFNNRRE